MPSPLHDSNKPRIQAFIRTTGGETIPLGELTITNVKTERLPIVSGEALTVSFTCESTVTRRPWWRRLLARIGVRS